MTRQNGHLILETRLMPRRKTATIAELPGYHVRSAAIALSRFKAEAYDRQFTTAAALLDEISITGHFRRSHEQSGAEKE